jgi:serine/threonine protein kinase
VGIVVYLLVFGRQPFRRGKDEVKSIIRGKWAFPSAASTVSASVRDLITRCLTIDPTKRLTAAQALEVRVSALARGRSERC